MENAPLFKDIADGPAGGEGFWLKTSDDIRIRIGVWPRGEKGTVLLFPGRTEWIEKYGRAAADFAARGYATVSIDWRGQGIADRLIPNRAIGHVGSFTDYQRDVAAVMDAVAMLDLPKPFYLIGHSMGGAIGLRALHRALDVRAAVFTAPMWGIAMHPLTRPFARMMARLSKPLGFSTKLVPSTKEANYVLDAPFTDNTLTTDKNMWAYMVAQLTAQPGLAIGGPSYQWLGTALAECRDLCRSAPPDIPCLTFLGSNERIVDTRAVRQVMGNWPAGKLIELPGAEHEILMEKPAMRKDVLSQIDAHFSASP